MVVSLTDYRDLIDRDHTENRTTTVPPPPVAPAPPDEQKSKPFSCDHSISLYILNQSYFLETMGAHPVVYKDEAGECHPRYWASYVSYTNMLLVVVESVEREYGTLKGNCSRPPDTKPQATKESTSSREPCHKLDLGRLKRRRLEGCFTYHEGVTFSLHSALI